MSSAQVQTVIDATRDEVLMKSKGRGQKLAFDLIQ